MSITAPLGSSGTPETYHGENVTPLFRDQHPQLDDEGVFISAENTPEKAQRAPSHLVHGRVPVGKDELRWTLEVPEELQYDGIATFSSGYLGIKQSSRPIRNALVDQGIATLTFEPARKDDVSVMEAFRNPQSLHAQSLLAIAADLRFRTDIRRKIPNANRIDVNKKALVGHSMGGLATPRYALMETTAVDSIIGLATCGFGHPTMRELAVDFPAGIADSIRHEIVPALKAGHLELSLRNIRDFVRYYKELRVAFEGLSCLRDDIRPLVSTLHDKNIKYKYVAFAHDILVRPALDIVPHVAHHEIMANTGHLAPVMKAEKVARQIAPLILSSN